jgi:quercetin dioxygenase-like cupin family protein
MKSAKCLPGRRKLVAGLLVSAGGGLALGFVAGQGLADMPIPTEHNFVAIAEIGVIGEASMQKQIGLTGYVLQLREITIEPGGQIAQHSHANRPGVVKVLSGTWLEGRSSGETPYGPDSGGLLEDENTVHWFFNTGDTPATAIVCDIVPAS